VEDIMLRFSLLAVFVSSIGCISDHGEEKTAPAVVVTDDPSGTSSADDCVEVTTTGSGYSATCTYSCTMFGTPGNNGTYGACFVPPVPPATLGTAYNPTPPQTCSKGVPTNQICNYNTALPCTWKVTRCIPKMPPAP
jgi:hypothetical protein